MKGIYPNWVDDKDIINQVLNEVNREGGRLPYTFVVNPEHPPEVKLRMKHILERMQHEKLIIVSKNGTDFLEMDVEGSRALLVGYRKYHRHEKWSGFRFVSNRILLAILLLAALALIAELFHFVWQIFKKD